MNITQQEVDDYFDNLSTVNVDEMPPAAPVVRSLMERPCILRGALAGIGEGLTADQHALALYVIGFKIGAHFANRRIDLAELEATQ